VVTLYVMSMEQFSGKTAVCLGLASKMASDGLRVGYMKPVAMAFKSPEGADVDTSFMKRSLKLEEPMDELTPVIIDGRALEQIYGDRIGDLAPRVRKAFASVSRDKDAVVVEGLNGLSEGVAIGLDNRSMASILDGRCLLVVKGAAEHMVDDVLAVEQALGDRLLGVVLNSVPRGTMEFVSETLTPFITRRGIKVYAVLPEDRLLTSAAVGEIVERLGGKVIAGQDRMNELVENVMVGAMSAEHALNYFRRRPNKVVITGGDRADLQLAALETSTKCLVLTGDLYPHPMILGRAEELGVPVVLVSQDTLGAVDLIDQVFTEVRFHQDKKIKRFFGMLATSFKYDELRQDLGL
jgi:uncharacterized protein